MFAYDRIGLFLKNHLVQLQELACGKSVGLSDGKTDNSILALITMTKPFLAPEETVIQEIQSPINCHRERILLTSCVRQQPTLHRRKSTTFTLSFQPEPGPLCKG